MHLSPANQLPIESTLRSSISKHVQHGTNRSFVHPLCRLVAQSCVVRGEQYVRELQQSRTDGRFLLEHVKSRTAECAAGERRDKGVLVDNATPARVDENCLRPHQSKLAGADQVARLAAERKVQRDGVHPGKKLIKGATGFKRGIAHDYRGTEGLDTARDSPTDPTEAHDPDRAGVKLRRQVG